VAPAAFRPGGARVSLREPIEMRRRKLGAAQRAEPPTRRRGASHGVLTVGSYRPIWPKSRRDGTSIWTAALRIAATGKDAYRSLRGTRRWMRGFVRGYGRGDTEPGLLADTGPMWHMGQRGRS
jgi:hypothetical protein